MEHLPHLFAKLAHVELWLGYYYRNNIRRQIGRLEYARKRLIRKIISIQLKELDRE